ncbi:MAG: response regulator transcription factor [Acidobacteriia bacterium]|nr:response regulator transcription factor [Terriglobia bacterium]MBV8906048.1 response regulator transcription factor [Terriglobia bacterium]
MPSQPASVLVVDDEPALRKTLRASLSASGFSVSEARNGEEALGAVQQRVFDLVLLDINMPGANGIDACRRIRTVAPQIGIIMITVRDSENDKVHALEAGADDYVTKPFRLRELVARLRAVLRRTGPGETPEPETLKAGDLEIDVKRRLLHRGGERIHLSPKEFELLAYMMQNPGIPLTHSRLLRSLWGPEYGNELEYLRSYVKALRKKIEPDSANPQYILTEPWVGYRFRDPLDPDAPSVAADEE